MLPRFFKLVKSRPKPQIIKKERTVMTMLLFLNGLSPLWQFLRILSPAMLSTSSCCSGNLLSAPVKRQKAFSNSERDLTNETKINQLFQTNMT